MSREIILKKLELPNGETLGYRESGSGDKTLLLIHSNMNSSINWDLLIENLPESFKVYAVDLRGMGSSTYNHPVESIKDFSEDIKLFADGLGLKTFTVAGWSAGGAIAMRLAIDHSDYVEKLILLESANIKGYPLPKRTLLGKPKEGQFVTTKGEMDKAVRMITKAYAKRRTWFLRKMLESSLYSENKPNDERYNQYLEEMMRQKNLVDLNIALGQFNISHEHNGIEGGTGEVDLLELPVLIIQGAKDKVVSMKTAKYNLEAIGDNAQLVVLEDSGHSPLLDELDKLTEAIVDFVKDKKED